MCVLITGMFQVSNTARSRSGDPVSMHPGWPPDVRQRSGRRKPPTTAGHSGMHASRQVRWPNAAEHRRLMRAGTAEECP